MEDINIIISIIHNKIDYSIKDIEDRKKLIDEMLFEYNDIIYNYIDKYGLQSDSDLSYLLDRMCNYLVYDDRKKWRKEKKRIKDIIKNEISVDNVEKYLDIKNKEAKSSSGYDLNPKAIITSKDLKRYKEIEQIYNAIHIYQQIRSKSKNSKDIFKINRVISQLKIDAIYIKEFLSGMFEFKNIIFNKPKYNFDNDTGYFDVNDDYILVSENQLDYGNKKHISYLIKFYSRLKQESYNDNNADMKYILFLLEYLIDNTGLSDREKDIVLWIIDEFNYEIISEKLKEKYNIDWYGDTVSRTFDSICSKIADFYEKDYEDWFYTFVARGVYKTCSKCGEVKLANERYFGKDERNNDKLKSICKECDRKSKQVM